MTLAQSLLLGWSAAALAWWGLAWLLIRRCLRAPVVPAGPTLKESLTIFKPLPQLRPGGLTPRLRAALTSFVNQLDDNSEMLLGVHEADRAQVHPWFEELLATVPAGRLRVLYRAEPDACANPKIAWLSWLAPQAGGQWWLWSDADIVAPPHWLAGARERMAVIGEARLLTFPYYVQQPDHPAGWWDAAFINAEMLPGASLFVALRRPADFAFGAAMLFRAADFQARGDWADLGRYLADDFAIGQLMRPCRISLPPLETLAQESSWREALRHYFRWHKTVRWCQPLGYLGLQLLTTPLLGWLGYALAHPRSGVGWSALAGQVLVELAVITRLSRLTGADWVRGRGWTPLAAWPLLRSAVGLAVWLPIPVGWNHTRWRGLTHPTPPARPEPPSSPP
jgi:Glycosyl transferase family 21